MPALPIFSDIIVLIIEANESLKNPYTFMSGVYDTRRISSIERAVIEIGLKPPELVLLSASFAPKGTFKVLEALRETSVFSVIPLLIIVDLSYRISTVLGISWGGKIAVVDSRILKKDFFSIIKRITHTASSSSSLQ